eukprot:scaffold3404_cov124-Skeletonema_marinoi.AAC.1
MMTSQGAMIRLVFSSPTLTPPDDTAPFASFVYPNNNNNSSTLPMRIGQEQVCFPTPTTVVYTTNTNENGSSSTLYCIDLGDAIPQTNDSGGGGTLSITTRVWSTIHKIVDSPSSQTDDNNHNYSNCTARTPGAVRKMEGAHPNSAARKKARYSLGNVLSSVYTKVVGGDDGVNEEYEYNDDHD